jgi:hypothetical protein
MSDIVERLRDSDQIDVFGLRLEAADEIERLRAALEMYGLHLWDCPKNDSPEENPDCLCGFDAAVMRQARTCGALCGSWWNWLAPGSDERQR